MTKTMAFDTETIADKTKIPFLQDVKPKKGLTDPIKIKKNIKEKKEKQLAEMALNPISAQICCFSWHNEKQAQSLMLKEETQAAEKKLIQQIWEVLYEFEHFVSFNGINFDVPLLKMRSLVHRVMPSINISTKRYTVQNHTDCRMILGNWDKFASGTLGFYSQILLGKSPKEEYTGDQVQDLWDMELFNEIKNYCQFDTVCTMELYQLIQQYYQ